MISKIEVMKNTLTDATGEPDLDRDLQIPETMQFNTQMSSTTFQNLTQKPWFLLHDSVTIFIVEEQKENKYL